jgi:hypothetical protein
MKETEMLTEKQNAVMNWIAFNEMTSLNGGRPECANDAQCFLWVDEIAAHCGVTIREAQGVIGSLAAQGYIGCERGRGNDNGVWFTEEGYRVWSEQNP